MHLDDMYPTTRNRPITEFLLFILNYSRQIVYPIATNEFYIVVKDIQ